VRDWIFMATSILQAIKTRCLARATQNGSGDRTQRSCKPASCKLEDQTCYDFGYLAYGLFD